MTEQDSTYLQSARIALARLTFVEATIGRWYGPRTPYLDRLDEEYDRLVQTDGLALCDECRSHFVDVDGQVTTFDYPTAAGETEMDTTSLCPDCLA